MFTVSGEWSTCDLFHMNWFVWNKMKIDLVFNMMVFVWVNVYIFVFTRLRFDFTTLYFCQNIECLRFLFSHGQFELWSLCRSRYPLSDCSSSVLCVSICSLHSLTMACSLVISPFKSCNTTPFAILCLFSRFCVALNSFSCFDFSFMSSFLYCRMAFAHSSILKTKNVQIEERNVKLRYYSWKLIMFMHRIALSFRPFQYLVRFKICMCYDLL